MKVYKCKVYAEPRKAWKFIFKIPGLEKPGKNEIIDEMFGTTWNFAQTKKNFFFFKNV